jgi:hypothetical protein
MPDKTMPKLKPCPFCDCEPKFATHECQEKIGYDRRITLTKKAYSIACPTLGCIRRTNTSKKDLVKEWNTRSDTIRDPQELVETLREIIRKEYLGNDTDLIKVNALLMEIADVAKQALAKWEGQ